MTGLSNKSRPCNQNKSRFRITNNKQIFKKWT